MNPYAKFLDGRPVIDILAATAIEMRVSVAAIGAARLHQPPAPGKWCAAEIVAHLADCEIAHAFRIRQLLAEDSPIIQPFDQDKWAANCKGLPVDSALSCFAALRAWTLDLVRATDDCAALRTLRHPEQGLLTYQDYLERMAGHDLDHLAQLHKMAGF